LMRRSSAEARSSTGAGWNWFMGRHIPFVR
jgi:hypothetical protein